MSNVFVLGLDAFNLAKLEALDGAEACRFHPLLTPGEILDADAFDVEDMLARATAQLRAFDGPVDAVVGYMDFPVSTMLPVLAAEAGAPSVSLEALLACEHKYYSRLLQREVVGEHVPDFVAFDPFDDDAASRIDLAMPYWIKPVKSAGSWLGFRVDDPADLDAALVTIRREIGRFADPFNDLLARAELPAAVTAVDGGHCLAEGIIGGWQCTLEGARLHGETRVHGVIDSVRLPGGSSFERYQYPSRLDDGVIARMTGITDRLLAHVGFDRAAFNVEFFYDADRDHLWLLEVNTRIAQHHSDLFEKVDGASNHQVMLDVHLGREPRMPHRQGEFAVAAACFLRHDRDAVITSVPDEASVAALQREIPGLEVQLHVRPGQRLSELVDQDSYSYELALCYLGADDEAQLLDRWETCRQRLVFGLDEEG